MQLVLQNIIKTIRNTRSSYEASNIKNSAIIIAKINNTSVFFRLLLIGGQLTTPLLVQSTFLVPAHISALDTSNQIKVQN